MKVILVYHHFNGPQLLLYYCDTTTTILWLYRYCTSPIMSICNDYYEIITERFLYYCLTAIALWLYYCCSNAALILLVIAMAINMTTGWDGKGVSRGKKCPIHLPTHRFRLANCGLRWGGMWANGGVWNSDFSKTHTPKHVRICVRQKMAWPHKRFFFLGFVWKNIWVRTHMN